MTYLLVSLHQIGRAQFFEYFEHYTETKISIPMVIHGVKCKFLQLHPFLGQSIPWIFVLK